MVSESRLQHRVRNILQKCILRKIAAFLIHGCANSPRVHVSTIRVDRNSVVCAAMVPDALCSHGSFAKVSARPKKVTGDDFARVQQSGK